MTEESRFKADPSNLEVASVYHSNFLLRVPTGRRTWSRTHVAVCGDDFLRKSGARLKMPRSLRDSLSLKCVALYSFQTSISACTVNSAKEE